MSADYKPGTVAVIAADFGDQGFDNTRAFRIENGWATEYGEYHDRYVTDVRPLVVLDPDDREQMDAFCKRLVEVANAEREIALATSGIHPDTVAAALRSLSRPPKPAEPQGLGAVVEDASGAIWVLVPRDGNAAQTEWVTHHSTCRTWGAIDAVRVLSEGVQP